MPSENNWHLFAHLRCALSGSDTVLNASGFLFSSQYWRKPPDRRITHLIVSSPPLAVCDMVHNMNVWVQTAQRCIPGSGTSMLQDMEP